jgi:4-hydroxy-tetrahydrodipicolinate synthase
MSWQYRGILPAMQLPFDGDLSIDEVELRRFTKWLAGHKGIGGLVTNGHTGEVFALTAEQRAEVTRIVADEVKDRLPVVCGICCEGISEAIGQAQKAREAGASALLVMPPHQWLRFGMKQPYNVIDYFTAVGKASELDIIVHIYPAWTRASYNFDTLAALAELPWVKSMKVGTRNMNKYARDVCTIKQANPNVTVLTCHDEYLLPSMVQGVDGALVGFACLVPQMIIDLYAAVCNGDLKRAIAIQNRINPLKDAVYGSGEPTADAHARMKMAMYFAGILKSPTVQPPTRLPAGAELEAIREAVRTSGMMQRGAA